LNEKGRVEMGEMAKKIEWVKLRRRDLEMGWERWNDCLKKIGRGVGYPRCLKE
jgi:hypothetical protein